MGWLLLVNGVAFLWRLGQVGLVDETEPLFAEAARQMVITGDWVTPYFNEQTRFDKPPLIYWLMAIAYQTIGVNEWAVRLPSALAAIALTVFGFFTLRQFGWLEGSDRQEADRQSSWSVKEPASAVEPQRWLSAWMGAALMAFNLLTVVWARTGVSDMLLSGCLGSALLAFFWGYQQPVGSSAKPWWYLAFYGLTALAVLTKGPVGVVLPVLIVGAFLLYVGQASVVVREMQLLRGALIFLAIAVPWYVLVILANGDAFIQSFFEYHNFERFTRAVNNHKEPWSFYFVVVLLGCAPWSVYLPAAIARLQFWQPGYWRQQPRKMHLGLFALIWLVVIFGFFTLARTKLPSYVLPLVPAAAILVSLFWSESMLRPRFHLGLWLSHMVNLVLLLMLGGAVFYSVHWMGGDPSMPNFPAIAQQSGVLIWGGSIWTVAALVELVLLLKRQGRWIGWVNVVAFGGFLVFTAMPLISLMDGQRQLPLRQLAATIMQERSPQEELVMVGFPKPSLVFYTRQPVTYTVKPKDLANRLQAYRSKRQRSLLVLGFPRRLKALQLNPDHYETLGQAGEYELIRVMLPLSR